MCTHDKLVAPEVRTNVDSNILSVHSVVSIVIELLEERILATNG